MNMYDYISMTIQNILSYPEEFSLEEIKGERVSFYQMSCHKEDLKNVIGRGGQTITALRRLFNVVGMKNGKKIHFEVRD